MNFSINSGARPREKTPKGMTERFPNTILGGPTKSGTSSLFFWLQEHPEVCTSHKKETHFLSDKQTRHNRKANIHKDGIEAYGTFFSHCSDEKVIMEATPEYFTHHTPREIFSRWDPPPVLIFLLRDPADRIHSIYRFNRFRRKLTEVSFKAFIDPERRPSFFDDPLESSDYPKYLKKWIQAIGREKVRPYLFEELKNAPKETMEKIAGDLGIDPGFYERTRLITRNKTLSVRSKRIHQWGQKIQPWIPGFLQKTLLPLYLKLNSGNAPPPSPEEIAIKKQLSARFRNTKEELKALFPHLDIEAYWDGSGENDRQGASARIP